MVAEYTSNGLLVISKEVIEVYLRDLKKVHDGSGEGSIDYAQFSNSLFDRVNNDNSELYNNLFELARESLRRVSSDPRHETYLVHGILTGYALMDRQAEVNELEEES